MKTFSLALAMILLASPFALADEPNEYQRFAGGWKLVAMEAGGQEVPEGELPPVEISFTEEGVGRAVGPDGEMVGRYKLDETLEPATIDIAHEEGPEAGKDQFGIYEFTEEDQKLRLCLLPPGESAAERPSEFRTEHTKCLVMVLERGE